MIDIVREIEATRREVGRGRVPAGEGVRVTLTRTYSAPIDDVWDALTSPERIGRWFLPVSGDYRLGGTYQFEGNAGGHIVACNRPTLLKVTWAYPLTEEAEAASEVELRLTADGDASTTVALEHTAVVPEDMAELYGPGAVGVGWDGGMLGLALHLQGGTVGDPTEWMASEEGRAFYRLCSEKWGAASVAAGADPDVAAQGVANTIEFYAPSGAGSGAGDGA